jgi:hypothetical protein
MMARVTPSRNAEKHNHQNEQHRTSNHNDHYFWNEGKDDAPCLAAFDLLYRSKMTGKVIIPA